MPQNEKRAGRSDATDPTTMHPGRLILPVLPALVNAAADGARELPPLPLIDDLAVAWLEAAATRAEQQAARWEPGELAAAADDRLRPPIESTAAPWEPAELAEWASFEPQTEGQNQTFDAPQTGLSGASVGPLERAPLGLRREVISTVGRYLVALQRVDAAYGVLERRLEQAAVEAASGWSSAACLRAGAIRRKLDATRRRRLAMRACMLGQQQLTRFLCRCCGSLQWGPPAGCNSRTCPRCVRKLRRSAMAKVGRILENVEEKRLNEGKSLVKWRFLTLTAPSWRAFLPMRTHLARSWARVLRARVWLDHVRAAVVAWECTHTAAGWHVHLHGVADAFVPRSALSRAWQCAQLIELAADAVAGRLQVGAPPAVLEVLDTVRAAPLHTTVDAPRSRRTFRRAVSLVCRLASRWHLELAKVLFPDAARELAPHEDRGRWHASCAVVLALVWLPELRALLGGVSNPAGVNIQAPTGDRTAILSELAKYCGKDLGGAQCEDLGEWGIAGTPDRLAEFIDGARRWRTLRTYGDAYDRDDGGAVLECDDCGAPSMTFDGVAWMPAEKAEEVAAAQRQRRNARREFRGTAKHSTGT